MSELLPSNKQHETWVMQIVAKQKQIIISTDMHIFVIGMQKNRSRFYTI